MRRSHSPLGGLQKEQPLSVQTQEEAHTQLHVMKADPQLSPDRGLPSLAELSWEGDGASLTNAMGVQLEPSLRSISRYPLRESGLGPKLWGMPRFGC